MENLIEAADKVAEKLEVQTENYVIENRLLISP